MVVILLKKLLFYLVTKLTRVTICLIPCIPVVFSSNLWTSRLWFLFF